MKCNKETLWQNRCESKTSNLLHRDWYHLCGKITSKIGLPCDNVFLFPS